MKTQGQHSLSACLVSVELRQKRHQPCGLAGGIQPLQPLRAPFVLSLFHSGCEKIRDHCQERAWSPTPTSGVCTSSPEGFFCACPKESDHLQRHCRDKRKAQKYSVSSLFATQTAPNNPHIDSTRPLKGCGTSPLSPRSVGSGRPSPHVHPPQAVAEPSFLCVCWRGHNQQQTVFPWNPVSALPQCLARWYVHIHVEGTRHHLVFLRARFLRLRNTNPQKPTSPIARWSSSDAHMPIAEWGRHGDATEQVLSGLRDSKM